MREIVEDVARWREQGLRVALARVVDVVGSSPRDPGAAMAVNERGEVAGSVSGGCVEGAVVTEALAALESGTPRLCTFGYSDEEAFAVGLTCGGTLRVLVHTEVPPGFEELRAALRAEEPVALATVVGREGPAAEGVAAAENAVEPPFRLGATMLVRPGREPVGTLGAAELDRVVERDALGALAAGQSRSRHYGPQGEARRGDVGVFIEAFAPPPRMVVFGAVDFTAALARVAKVLGYRVTVCDARPVFATPARFPMADEVVVEWPERYLAKVGPALGPRDAVCVLTHDPKFDVPAIRAALETRVGYLGAMGSRRTHQERTERLRAAGVPEHELARVMGPIGLDIGARTPEETAISICGEIIALRTGRAARSLRDSEGPIHERVTSRET
jgi:xanthine dehydrogenase accessory factor